MINIDLNTVAVFLIAIVLHELAHAWTAVALGDPTPRHEGRLTLNLFSHLSLPGTLMLLFIGIGWAKPVRINPRNFRNPAKDMLWVSLAGPLTNFALALIFAWVWRATANSLPLNWLGVTIAEFLWVGIYLNLLLGFFNLIPVPPLDGSKIVMPFLPPLWAFRLRQVEPWGFLIILVLFRVLDLSRYLLMATLWGMRVLGLV